MMIESTKIDFRYRCVRQVSDVTDLVQMFFPGNRNQQHAAARILLELRAASGIKSTLTFLQKEHGISRRTLQRTRAKLARLGLIEHVSWMNTRYGGQTGWKLSSRMDAALRHIANKINEWRNDKRPDRRAKDEQLTELLK